MLFGKKIEKTLKVVGMKCPHCKMKIESALKTVDGVKKVNADVGAKIVKVVLKTDVDASVLLNAIEKAGFDATVI